MSVSNASDPTGRQPDRRKLIAVVHADMVGYSRLIGLDDVGTLERLRTLRSRLIDPAIAEHGGRIVNTGGDSVLIVFDSVDGAVRCAVKVQQGVPTLDRDQPPDRAMRFRVGINAGDVIPDGTDVHGDVVNVAARLQAECPPGGICVSRAVREHLQDRPDLVFEELGALVLKNIPRPVEAFLVKFGKQTDSPRTVAKSGFDRTAPVKVTAFEPPNFQVRYCKTADGVRLAYAKIGEGATLVTVGHWMTHMHYGWENAIRRGAWLRLSGGRQHIFYDWRGCGLSDRNIGEITHEIWVSDLETVVEASGAGRFALFGASASASVAVAYAARHPERVSALVLYGGYPRGRYLWSAANLKQEEAIRLLTRLGWDQDNPAFRQIFTSEFMPGASKEQFDAFTESGRKCTSGECAAQHLNATGWADVTSALGRITAPTLVLHAIGDVRVPFEHARELAAAIPAANLATLPGQNHIPTEGDPAYEMLWKEVDQFLRKHEATG
jgi:class 3 adenylate cyclase/pimeloyl-ACP methyl ester carboxylesterase